MVKKYETWYPHRLRKINADLYETGEKKRLKNKWKKTKNCGPCEL